MGEVDQQDDAVDHGIPKGDEGVDAAEGDAVDQLLNEKFHGISVPGPRKRGPGRFV